MGNCLSWHLHQSQDHLTATAGYAMEEKERNEIEEKGLLVVGDHHVTTTSSSTSTSTSTSTTTKVKIKISKEQLEEFLGKVEVGELSVQQILSQSMDVSGNHHQSYYDQQYSSTWRPNLQSIPE